VPIESQVITPPGLDPLSDVSFYVPATEPTTRSRLTKKRDDCFPMPPPEVMEDAFVRREYKVVWNDEIIDEQRHGTEVGGDPVDALTNRTNPQNGKRSSPPSCGVARVAARQ
jgi:hypothetical protein